MLYNTGGMDRGRRVVVYSPSPSRSGDAATPTRGAVTAESRLGRVRPPSPGQATPLNSVAGPSAPRTRSGAGKRSHPLSPSPPAKRAPPTPGDADGPLQLILREMRRISQRVGALEKGDCVVESGVAASRGRPLPVPPASSRAPRNLADSDVSVTEVQPLPGCSSFASPPPPVPAPVPPASEEKDSWAEQELVLHASGSSDGSLFSPLSGEDERGVGWEDTSRVVKEVSLLSEVMLRSRGVLL